MVVRSLDDALRCTDRRCGTLLAPDAELCDECGGSDLVPASQGDAVLLGLAGERPVAFEVPQARPIIVGRGAGDEVPDIDLSRFPGSGSVHRRHARLEYVSGAWRIFHLGRN